MKPRPGSLLWLVAHEVTLNWRRFLDMFGRLTPVEFQPGEIERVGEGKGVEL